MFDRDKISFVLVRPTYLGNIGSTARVLKNFGFKNLRLVNPPKNYKDAEARKMSVGAFDLLKSALCFDSFADAQKDISISIGTTCAYQRDCQPEFLDQVSDQLKSRTADRIAIFFGDERDGLMREELDRCHYVISVPTMTEFPSLNVAQAVGIFAYELIRAANAQHNESEEAVDDYKSVRNKSESRSVVEGESSASGAETDEYFDRLSILLAEMGFTKSFNRESILTELRAVYNRARPTERELRLLSAILRKVDSSQSSKPSSNK